MSWYSIPRLGPAGGEIDLNCKVIDIEMPQNNVEMEQRNLLGANMKAYLRQNVPTATLTLALVPDALMSILRGFSAALKTLNFIHNSTLAVKYLMATSATTLSVVIPPSSASGVTITGVFLQSDTTQTGTNYFSGGGSFNATTGTITLGSALPGANTDVWVNYTFTGLSCWARITSAKPHRGQYVGYWQVTLELTGA